MAKFKFKTAKKKGKLFRYKDTLEQVKKISGARIEILSNREMSIDGCKGIVEYNDEYIKIRISEGFVVLLGSGFKIPVFDGLLITISGKISNIEFSLR